MSSVYLTPADVYTNGVITGGSGIGDNIWAEDPFADAGDASYVTLTAPTAENAHGWLPAMGISPSQVQAVWLEAYMAASDTANPNVDVEFEIVFASGSTGPTAPFTDYATDLVVTNDATLTPTLVLLQLTDANQAVSAFAMSDVISHLTQTGPSSPGPRAIRFSTSGLAVAASAGTRTIRIAACRIRLDLTGYAPPLRLTNRDDVFSSAPSLTRSRSQQGTNSPTAYL